MEEAISIFDIIKIGVGCDMISGRETPAKKKQWKGRISRVSMNNKNKKKKEVNLTNESSH